ncbi:YciI family protein [Paracoccus aestuariivivens]|uniref:YciI family protein n=1 Tax=Paracoccus aestuariivivens TaxID=1820333 RepID=A0A6L6JHD3_9RHOB|nr:YciI family protein [Paracoccus aestuariivivens]MTH80099.1 YciI family protein [Paracoccus aestuariivivens]
MRVMVLVKATEESEAGEMPTAELLGQMLAFNEQLANAGILLAGDGLKPTTKAKRVHITGADRRVVDGPFAETHELVAGYWLWQVRDMDEAVEWARRCPPPMPREGVLEIRPLYEAEDFGEIADAEQSGRWDDLTQRMRF